MKKKKGFTLVELLVCITLISILTVVGIITYNTLIDKAKLAKDKSVMVQMNLVLKGNEYSDLEHTMTSALEQVKEELSDEQMKLETTGAIWGYDSSTNRFLVIKKNKVILSDTEEYGSKSEIFIEVHNEWELVGNTKGYAAYISEDYDSSIIYHNSGIDLGNNTNVKTIVYSHITSTSPNNVLIKTNSSDCVVYIYGPDDHVEHYGEAKEVYVVSVDHYSSYHEYGTIGDLKVTSGRIIIENEGYVINLIECDYPFTSGINIYKTDKDISSIIIKGTVENHD